MTRRIAAVGRVSVSDRRSTRPSWSATLASATEHLRDQEGQLQGLPGVQPGITRGLVPAVEVFVADLLGAAQALGDVLAGELHVDAAGPGAQPAVHVEEAEHLVDDPVEVAGLFYAGRLLGVGVRRGALPPHPSVPGGGLLPPPPPPA